MSAMSNLATITEEMNRVETELRQKPGLTADEFDEAMAPYERALIEALGNRE